MMGGGMGMGSGMSGFMGFGWIFWLLLIIGGLYLIVRALKGKESISAKQESALDILRKRYAAGEISDEEFERKKDQLR